MTNLQIEIGGLVEEGRKLMPSISLAPVQQHEKVLGVIEDEELRALYVGVTLKLAQTRAEIAYRRELAFSKHDKRAVERDSQRIEIYQKLMMDALNLQLRDAFNCYKGEISIRDGWRVVRAQAQTAGYLNAGLFDFPWRIAPPQSQNTDDDE